MRKFSYAMLLGVLLWVGGAANAVDYLSPNADAFGEAALDILYSGTASSEFQASAGKFYPIGNYGREATIMTFRSYSGEAFNADQVVSQSIYDGFRKSYKDRLGVARLGVISGDRYANTGFSSDEAFAAPALRSGNNKRQLDCVYNSGFTVWADGYGNWSNQRSRNDISGYRHHNGGAAIGFDWSNGSFTAGIATTLNTGKIKAYDLWEPHTRKTRTWGVALYGQWNVGQLYLNADLGYANNRFKSDREVYAGTRDDNVLTARYRSHAINFGAEAGYKIGLQGFTITPNVGLRYYHDRRQGFSEGSNVSYAPKLTIAKNNYHVLELPIGVNVGYEIQSGGMVFVPEAKFAWVPELDRGKTFTTASLSSDRGYSWTTHGPKRSRHAFVAGAGVKAKITSMISAHLNYELELRNRYREHNINAGIGFSF